MANQHAQTHIGIIRINLCMSTCVLMRAFHSATLKHSRSASLICDFFSFKKQPYIDQTKSILHRSQQVETKTTMMSYSSIKSTRTDHYNNAAAYHKILKSKIKGLHCTL